MYQPGPPGMLPRNVPLQLGRFGAVSLAAAVALVLGGCAQGTLGLTLAERRVKLRAARQRDRYGGDGDYAG